MARDLDYGSLEDVVTRQDGDTSESLLFETMELGPVEVVARDDKNLFQKIGGFFSGAYDGLKDFYSVAPPFVTSLTGGYVGISVFYSLFSGFASMGLTLIPFHAAIIGYFGSQYYKEFREVRDHLKINGWDEKFIEDRIENRIKTPLKMKIFGDKLSDGEYRKILGRAANKAGYLEEFNRLVESEGI